jgi:hypothetical protein
MNLTLMAGCYPEDCPRVYETDRGTIAVQGYTVTDPDLVARANLQPRESLVEAPLSLLVEAGCFRDDTSRFRLTGRGTVIVRGDTVTDPSALAQASAPVGESLVELPMTLEGEVAA